MGRICHFDSSFYNQLDERSGLASIYLRVAGLGWVGVDIFFVLSGYLISAILLAPGRENRLSYPVFLVRRAIRLLPAYYVCIGVVGVLALILTPDSKVVRDQPWLWLLSSDILSCFIDRGGAADANFLLLHFWSLAVEWHFYILAPLLLRTRHKIAIALVLIAVAVLTRLVFIALGLSDNATYSFTLCRIDSFAFGYLVATARPAWIQGREGLAAFAGIVLFASIMTGIGVSSENIGPVAFKKMVWVQSIGYSLIAASIALILQGIIARQDHFMVRRFLEARPLLMIGRASYSVYLWHLVFMPITVRMARGTFADPVHQLLMQFGLGVPLAFGLGFLSYWLFERSLEFLRTARFTALSKLAIGRAAP
ncbi:MAG: acyltransferase [Azospirillaceae bacterium]|nr:acyltransferase [Azospirillaceae bacterium]